tara:strand:- start:1214 stop:1414 length:201 start_codon:yes stop_codon:yes gene_type:complete
MKSFFQLFKILDNTAVFGCSPIKVVRELGSERRETVRSLSAMRVEEEIENIVQFNTHKLTQIIERN